MNHGRDVFIGIKLPGLLIVVLSIFVSVGSIVLLGGGHYEGNNVTDYVNPVLVLMRRYKRS